MRKLSPTTPKKNAQILVKPLDPPPQKGKKRERKKLKKKIGVFSKPIFFQTVKPGKT